jgi:hypothetical protein
LNKKNDNIPNNIYIITGVIILPILYQIEIGRIIAIDDKINPKIKIPFEDEQIYPWIINIIGKSK